MTRQGKGKLVTIEGIDGSGKTTQCRLLVKSLQEKGFDVVMVREPGSTELGEAIRNLVLGAGSISTECELFLFAAARAALVREVILPCLDKGKVIIADRFADSTVAYQVFGGGLDFSRVEVVNQIATLGIEPDITLVLDIDPVKAARRLIHRDRVEQKGTDFQVKVRNGYLQIASQNSGRVVVLDADRPPDVVHLDVLKEVMGRLSR